MSLNFFKYIEVIEAESASSLASKLRAIPFAFQLNQVYSDGSKHYAFINANKKLSEKELQQLKDFQVQSNNIVFALGQLYLREVFNKESKDKLVKDYKALNSQSDSIARDLQEKYGEGSIDLEKGEFIKSE